MVDNSSAFRMTEGVPLIIPEVNADHLNGHKSGKGGIIANPNCSTIIALMAVTPIHRAAGVKRMVVSTYQVNTLIPLRGMCELQCNLICFMPHGARLRGAWSRWPGAHWAHNAAVTSIKLDSHCSVC